MASAVAMNVFAVVMTSSPGPNSQRKQRQMQSAGSGIEGYTITRVAVFRELTLEQFYLLTQNKRRPFGGPANAGRISSRSSKYCVFRSKYGTFMAAPY